MRKVLKLLIAVLAAIAAAQSAAATIGGNPGPQYNYVCPNSDNKPALDCYFDAVGHLYTMCRYVKSIEIIEFGYAHAAEGTNGAKSDSCLVKQKLNMTRPYQAALKSAAHSAKAVDGLRGLHELWLKSLAELAWIPGESDQAYKARTAQPYEQFAASIVSIQTEIQLAAAKQEEKKAATRHTRTAGKAKAAH